MRGHFMKKFIALAFVTTAALALTACGSSESAKEEAQADNVEMPAEEAVGDVDATPVADASAAAGAEAATDGDAAKQ
jgi:ABC-type oligopeptide transport system substrate-binding subunit